MKERDIVNFDVMKKRPGDGSPVDENGRVVGCKICYTHEKAFEVLKDKQFDNADVPATSEYVGLDWYHPLCPDCGKPLSHGASHGYASSGYVTVTEENTSTPEGEVSLCQVWHCANKKCPSESHQYLFAMMPIPISWNANHNIHITGGKTYLLEEEEEKFAKDIFEKFRPSIEQYIGRKLNPEDLADKSLDIWNVLTWCESDIESAIATWLYEHGLKK